MNSQLQHFHQHELPTLQAAGRDAMAARAARGLRPIALSAEEDGGPAFTFRPRADGIDVLPGCSDAAAVFALSSDSWQGLLQDLETGPGLLLRNAARCLRGEATQLIAWEPALRALYRGIPLYDPTTVDLRDRHGGSLSPSQRFSLASEDALMQDFLQAAGYLLVEQVFSPAEIEAMRSAAEALHSAAREGDGQSWWARDAEGRTLLCRVLLAGQHPVFEGLYEDPRLRRLAAIGPSGLKPCDPAEQDGITVIFKNPGVREGLSDLPWHRDCGLGGHAIMCPTVILSIYLYDATEEAGCLRFLPGSHRATCPFADAGGPDSPQGVRVDARAGSVTLHLSDVMHAAPAPAATKGPFRQSVLLSFKPDYQPHHGGRHYNDTLLERSPDGHVQGVREFAGKVR